MRSYSTGAAHRSDCACISLYHGNKYRHIIGTPANRMVVVPMMTVAMKDASFSRAACEGVRWMDVRELTRVCMPVVAFMQKNCTPHDTLVITGAQFKIVTDTVSIPVSGYGASDIDSLDVDGQTFPSMKQ